MGNLKEPSILRSIQICMTAFYSLCTAVSLTLTLACATAAKRPNIVVILADDMGIDSIAALNPKLGIKTPHLDKLARSGISFGDAHSSSAVCSPTRYGVLTGRYNWRSRLKRGIVAQWERPLIKDDRLTLPGLLKQNGYHTACIGKWHLGWNWPKKGGGFTTKLADIDFSQSTSGGPNDRGFDYYLGDDVPNWQPFVWIENGKPQHVPDGKVKFASHYHSGSGIGMKDWSLEKVLPTITQKSVDYITEQSKTKDPYFLFFTLTSPHTPIAPSKKFQGASGINRYADFLMETDWCVGQVLDAIEKSGQADNTLVIFTADNGTSPKCDFNDLLSKGANLQNHWKGMKADAWEGGHRVPFFASWPKVIPAGSSSDQTISLVDIMATCASAAELECPMNAAEDSVNLLNEMKGEKSLVPLHEAVICHSVSGVFVVRKGKWKLQYSAGSGGWSSPKDAQALKKGLPKHQLYDLSKDPKETTNLIAQYPEVVMGLTDVLKRYIAQGRSTPGPQQKNCDGQIWWRGLPWTQTAK
jgi:arylsulfatase A